MTFVAEGHIEMKFLDRVRTLAFRRQAVTWGGGVIVACLKGGWTPLNLLGTIFAWYILVLIVVVIASAVYHTYFAGPEDHVSLENFITIVSLVMLVFYGILLMYEKGWLPRSEDYD
jgi:hypothetical protein